MKIELCRILGAALLAACLGPSAAQAEGRKLRARVPFPFQAGAHALPAGQYEFEQDERRALLFITGPGGRRAALTTWPAGPPRGGEESHLVFECPEAGCRLAEVSAAGALHRAGVPAGKNPAPMAKGGRTEQVTVTLAVR